MDHSYLTGEFFKRYGNRDNKPVLFFSPGRVNLIGEHTDYNSGYVLPCALNFGTWLAIRPNEVNRINMASLNFDFTGSFSIETIRNRISGSWTNYPAGVINEFIDRGISLAGFDMLFYGDIPNGAGLSSSASIEMVTALAINTLSEAELDRLELVKLSQHAENHFVGMNCGIMDQFAVGFGRKNSALFLDCGTLDYEIVPFNPGKYRLIIANTNKRRGLTDSKYNERRAECEKAVEMLQPMKQSVSLTDFSSDDLPLLSNYITDDTILRRARHVITENRRVRLAVEALKHGSLTEFGSLMNDSHDSLRSDYEVTGHELDTMVYEARKIKGVIGSRMTGAGFGGCTVTLAEAGESSRFISKLGKEYEKLTGLSPEFYLPGIWDGACQI
jgi:galactokinase